MCTMNWLSIEISCYKRRFNICLLVSLASYYLWLPLTPTLYLPMLSGLHKVKKLDFLLFVLHVVVLRKKQGFPPFRKSICSFLPFSSSVHMKGTRTRSMRCQGLYLSEALAKMSGFVSAQFEVQVLPLGMTFTACIIWSMEDNLDSQNTRGNVN